MRHLLTALLLLLPALTQAQSFLPGKHSAVSYQSPVRWQPPGTPFALVRMAYSSDSVQNPTAWRPSMGTPTRLVLVYTAYPADTVLWLTPFSTLNGSRLAKAYAMDTRLQRVPLTLVAQTGPRSGLQATRYFHGICVEYIPTGQPVPDSLKITYPILHGKDTVVTEQTRPIPADTTLATTTTTPDTLPLVLPRVDYMHDTLKLYNPLQELIYERNMYNVQRIAEGGSVKVPVVLEALKRNTEWDSMLMVVDWTGSMYDYGAQVLYWQQRYSHRIRQLVLFNDGDDNLKSKAEQLQDKPLGNAGGIYGVATDSLPQLLAAMRYVMRRGAGGDIPENNIEALLKAHKQYPHHGDVVLIADNNSPIRDLELMMQLDFPVHVIVCDELFHSVHPHYVELAWMTGGSLHTLGQEVKFDRPRQPLGQLGQRIMGKQYYVQLGRLVY